MTKDPDATHEEIRAKLERQDKAMFETLKLEFEIHKTQATLVTGSLVAVIALSGLLVPEEPRYTLVLAVSCILLLFSMGWSLATMLGIATAVHATLSPWIAHDAAQESQHKVKSSRVLSLVSFPLGLGVFALYVYLNRFL